MNVAYIPEKVGRGRVFSGVIGGDYKTAVSEGMPKKITMFKALIVLQHKLFFDLPLNELVCSSTRHKTVSHGNPTSDAPNKSLFIAQFKSAATRVLGDTELPALAGNKCDGPGQNRYKCI